MPYRAERLDTVFLWSLPANRNVGDALQKDAFPKTELHLLHTLYLSGLPYSSNYKLICLYCSVAEIQSGESPCPVI